MYKKQTRKKRIVKKKSVRKRGGNNSSSSKGDSAASRFKFWVQSLFTYDEDNTVENNVEKNPPPKNEKTLAYPQLNRHNNRNSNANNNRNNSNNNSANNNNSNNRGARGIPQILNSNNIKMQINANN